MIVYGDSYTSGENNGNISFADYLGIEKRGISGSCLDEYSIYPVFNGGLISQLNNTNDTILIEYGINDAASLATGYIGYDTICIAVAKICDMLKGKDIYFLMLTKNRDDMARFSVNYAQYLNEDYLKDIYTVTARHYWDCYNSFCYIMRKKFKTIYMLPDGFREYDTDNIHPTDKGYRLIADNIKKQLA